MVPMLRIDYSLMVMKLDLALPTFELMASSHVVAALGLKIMRLELAPPTINLKASSSLIFD